MLSRTKYIAVWTLWTYADCGTVREGVRADTAGTFLGPPRMSHLAYLVPSRKAKGTRAIMVGSASVYTRRARRTHSTCSGGSPTALRPHSGQRGASAGVIPYGFPLV